MVFVRREDYEIFDNWHVMGMRGTGSKQAVLEDVFVPHRRAISQPAWLAADAPGYGLHDNPFYQTPPWQVFCAELASILVGLAEAAIDAFYERAMNKVSPWPPFELVRNERAAQRRIGYARAKTDGAAALLDRIVSDQLRRIERVTSGANTFIDEELRRAEMQMQQCFFQAQECVQLLFAASGSSAGQSGQLMERVFRDLNMAGTHYMLNADRTTENWGAMHFGLKPYSPN
jgi:3-hydroxy-9,10-secoandrosta-1,3,5(10)-triene-9,17-dione monooxygenase